MWASPKDCGMAPVDRANAVAKELGTSFMGASPINQAMAVAIEDLVVGSGGGDL